MSSELAPVDRLWPFGKYRGQAVERAMADHSYMEWVLAQPWFLEDYPQVYGLITSTTPGEPQDSPEHNAFQIRFLDEAVRLAVARRLGFEELDGEICGKRRSIAKRVADAMDCPVHEREKALGVSGVRFEDQGWDVAFEIHPANYVAWIDAPHRKDYIELLENWGMGALAAKTKARIQPNHGTLDVAVYTPNPGRRPRVLIELKPDLGDDYPSVLRQMQRYPADSKRSDRKLLIVRRARFTTVSYEQVQAFFRTADITLLMEWELEVPGAVEPPATSSEASAAVEGPASPAAQGRVLEPAGAAAVGSAGVLETIYSEEPSRPEHRPDYLEPGSLLAEELDEVDDFFGTDDDEFEEIDPDFLD